MIPTPEKISSQTALHLYKDDDIVPYETYCWDVTVHPINFMQPPYEATIMGRGQSFHVIFGNQINGKFLCIPSRGIGAELAALEDEYWNNRSLMSVGLSEMDAHTVAAGLSALKKYVVI